MKVSDYEDYHEIKEHYNNTFSYNTYPCCRPYDFQSVPLHWHNEMELIYIKKGTALITIDMNNYILDAGCVAIILPGRIHGIFSDGKSDYKSLNPESDIEYENIIFDIRMLYPKQSDIMTEQFFEKLCNNSLPYVCCITPSTSEYNTIISCLDEADNICRSFPQWYNLAIRSCLYRFFYIYSCLLSENENNTITAKSVNTEYIERLKLITKYIEMHYNEDISIKKMADLCNISQSHFMRFFKDNIGNSFIDYLNDYRLITASRLLTGSDSMITDIAIQCGFNNISYFNRLFKKKYNMSPGKFRKTYS